MDVPSPEPNKFTIYSKSGCPNCQKVKKLLTERGEPFSVVDCDEYLLENRDEFLQIMKTLTIEEYKMFPMVFDGTSFIGGYKETVTYLETKINFDINF